VTAALRPYDPETDADALYEMKTAFERGLGESTGGDEKAAAYEGSLPTTTASRGSRGWIGASLTTSGA